MPFSTISVVEQSPLSKLISVMISRIAACASERRSYRVMSSACSHAFRNLPIRSHISMGFSCRSNLRWRPACSCRSSASTAFRSLCRAFSRSTTASGGALSSSIICASRCSFRRSSSSCRASSAIFSSINRCASSSRAACSVSARSISLT